MTLNEADFRERFDRVVAMSHPRLGTRQDVLSEHLGDREPLMAAIIQEAQTIVPLPVLERKMTGRRLLSVSRTALQRISVLSIAWMRTHDPAFLARAEAELLAVCSFSDWNPSHYLDTAEMSLAVALGYDWLYNALPDASREAIADGLWRNGLQTAIDNAPWWVRASNNWGQVCHAGVTAAALALAERHPETAYDVVKRAFTNLPRAMEAYAPDGVYPEGPGYWDYGTSFNVVFFILVESTLGTSYGLDLMPGFAESADYMLHVTAPSGFYFNYADCNNTRRDSPCLFWFAHRFPDRLGGRVSGAFKEDWANMLESPRKLVRNRTAPFILFFGMGEDKNALDKHIDPLLDFHGRGTSEVVIMRSAWHDPLAWYLGVKGGTPSAPHGHMDGGSFILEAGGIRWAVEAGSENYHSIEKRGLNLWDGSQSGFRWDVFRYGNMSHNILVINGDRQIVKERADVRQVELGHASPRVVVDVSKLYGRSVNRTFDFSNRSSLTLTDEISGLTAGDVVRWQMLTAAAAVAQGPTLTLTQGGRKMTLTADVDVTWKVDEAASLMQDWDTPLKNLRVVYFERSGDASGAMRHSVAFSLGDNPRD